MVTTRAQYGLATSHTPLDFSVCAGISYDFVHRNARGKFRMLFSHINSDSISNSHINSEMVS